MQDEGRQAVKGLLLARPREPLGEPRVQDDHGGLRGQGRHQLLVLEGEAPVARFAEGEKPHQLALGFEANDPRQGHPGHAHERDSPRRSRGRDRARVQGRYSGDNPTAAMSVPALVVQRSHMAPCGMARVSVTRSRMRTGNGVGFLDARDVRGEVRPLAPIVVLVPVEVLADGVLDAAADLLGQEPHDEQHGRGEDGHGDHEEVERDPQVGEHFARPGRGRAGRFPPRR